MSYTAIAVATVLDIWICPLKARDSTIAEGVVFLGNTANGCLQLYRRHPYYAQVQLQLSSTKLDFLVWTPSDIFIECTYKDAVFVSVNLARGKPHFC